MAKANEDLLWKFAESDEIDIETRRHAKSPLHRTTIWAVPTEDGVYVRSVNGKRGRWYQEAAANPHVTIRVGRRKLAARVQHVKSGAENREVSKAYRVKYGERYPEETPSMLKRSSVPTTFRVVAE